MFCHYKTVVTKILNKDCADEENLRKYYCLNKLIEDSKINDIKT